MNFQKAVELRRSCYDIGENVTISEEKLSNTIDFCIKHAPSAFNSRSSRVVLLLFCQHKQLWDIVEESLRQIVSDNQFSKTKDKIDAFRKGYGTILFFEDSNVISSFKKDFKTYENHFDSWSLQGSAILQYLIWTTLSAEGLGASLQHYNPLIDDAVQKEWGIDKSWSLISQMPFGSKESDPEKKADESICNRFQIFQEKRNDT